MSVGTEDRTGSLSALSFIGFVVVALVAHILAWMWRPWLPGPSGYSMLLDGAKYAANVVTSYVA
jgi:light-harvesting complex 1 beta chain